MIMKPVEQDKWLNSSSENLGILRKLEDDTMLLAMERGGFSKEDLSFLRDDEGEEYVVFPQKLFVRLLTRIRNIQEEKLIMKLEKDIISQMPIDFDDVWCIALKEIKNYKKDPKKIIQNIKKRYPYLFVNFDLNNSMNNIRI